MRSAFQAVTGRAGGKPGLYSATIIRMPCNLRSSGWRQEEGDSSPDEETLMTCLLLGARMVVAGIPSTTATRDHAMRIEQLAAHGNPSGEASFDWPVRYLWGVTQVTGSSANKC